MRGDEHVKDESCIEDVAITKDYALARFYNKLISNS